MRLATVAVVLAAVVGLVPSAVAAEQDRLVFTDSNGVYVVAGDGSGRESIRDIRQLSCGTGFGSVPLPYCPAYARWSPDGMRLAFAERDRLYLWDFATRQTELVYTDVPVTSHWLAWSPDGTRVAFVGPTFNSPYFPPELYVQRVVGTRSTTRITTEGWVQGRPDWSPDGAWIAYPGRVGGQSSRVELMVVAADGSNRRQLTDGPQGSVYTFDPAWSPSGDRIAFVRGDPYVGSKNQLHVINADGAGHHAIANAPLAPRHPRWTSDGKRIVISAYAFDEGLPAGAGIWSVAADGSGSVQISEDRQNYDVSPHVSPGGNRIAFVRAEGLYESDKERLGVYVANADGTCERRIADVTPLAGLEWRPRAGAADERMECLDLVVASRKARYAVGETTIRFAFVNDGTQVIRKIRLWVNAGSAVRFSGRGDGVACLFAYGQFVCDLAELAAGERRNAEIDVHPLVVGRNAANGTPIRVHLGANAGAVEPDLSGNAFDVTVRPLDCAAGLADDSARTIQGAETNDRICGRVGNDVIKAHEGHDDVDAGAGNDLVLGGDGNDHLFGGPGNDTLVGGRGRDRLFGRSGHDRVLARDGQRDYVSCGAGRDLVLANRSDTVLRDCERVSRR